MREQIAGKAHLVWQRWMGYSLAHFDEEHLDRWRRQANTAYKDLAESEKESDRAIATEYLTLITERIKKSLLTDEEIDRLCRVETKVAPDVVVEDFVPNPLGRDIAQAQLDKVLKEIEK